MVLIILSRCHTANNNNANTFVKINLTDQVNHWQRKTDTRNHDRSHCSTLIGPVATSNPDSQAVLQSYFKIKL